MEKKSKLKGLFDDMDKKKQRKGQGIKLEEEKYKTKPTKPNFQNHIIGVGNNQYKGLNNNGNICYSNVVMQCLVALKEFTTMLKNIFEKVENNDSVISDYPMLYNLVKVMTFYESIYVLL
jgi:ubiquitin C-terminal hydrolase